MEVLDAYLAGGRRLTHAAFESAWVRDVNPQTSEFCNDAASEGKSPSIAPRAGRTRIWEICEYENPTRASAISGRIIIPS
ncbi:hypothetical protein PSAL_018500 [Pseudooceanicola algae]|uniref:Uncharacterized protein n=1 Tax=Pseudooceanicola algae TaxID=1537215 RepID=A0A418SL96_9RHOB|nr:hypothetical protein PSAL_018500 [Pseudooceanicola algae]